MTEATGCLTQEDVWRLKDNPGKVKLFYINSVGEIRLCEAEKLAFCDPLESYYFNYWFAYARSLKVKNRRR